MPLNPLVGLLPLYIELYDRTLPELRAPLEAFRDEVAAGLRQRGLEVLALPTCRVQAEFERAVTECEERGADCIVTLHLAYSPSLESAGVLSATSLPLVVLDTTPRGAFGPSTPPQEILYNHGIHGVQDLCNVLTRTGKDYFLEVGPLADGAVLDRVAGVARAAALATAMSQTRVGLIGEPFPGMGDFLVPRDELETALGLETIDYDWLEGRDYLAAVTEAEVEAECRRDLEAWEDGGVDPAVHRAGNRVGLAVRRWMERADLTAVSVNFLATDNQPLLPVMPFLEAAKAMERGLGYAGEGDVLTAAFTGALLSVYPDTTFSEMFCPDWEGNTVFLSHMGEINPRVCEGKPRLATMPWPFTQAGSPPVAYGRLRPGPACWANLAPMGDGGYALIIAAGEVPVLNEADALPTTIRGWFRARVPVAEFLRAYSQAGGTHHGALVYAGPAGAPAATAAQLETELAHFGRMMGWQVICI